MFAAQPIPLSACLLADHLDAILATGEDLLKARSKNPGDIDDPVEKIVAFRQAQRDAVERIRVLENALLARVMTARQRSAELSKADVRFRMMARLFTSGTAIVADAAMECSDSTEADFASADGVTAYLRSRGLLGESVPVLAETAGIAVEEKFLLGKCAPLGALMDLAAQFLDALEQHFDLYGVDIEQIDAASEFEAMTAGMAGQAADPARDQSAPKLDSIIETTLQAMFEPEQHRDGWAPGSLLAALAQIDADNAESGKTL